MPLTPILYDDLKALVQAAIDRLAIDEADFTAWDITQMLRNENADTEIMHQTVRALVHQLMFDAISAGLSYDAEQRDYSGQTALTYFYVDATTVQPAQFPTAAFPAGTQISVPTQNGQQISISLADWNKLYNQN